MQAEVRAQKTTRRGCGVAVIGGTHNDLHCVAGQLCGEKVRKESR